MCQCGLRTNRPSALAVSVCPKIACHRRVVTAASAVLLPF